MAFTAFEFEYFQNLWGQAFILFYYKWVSHVALEVESG